MDIWKVNIIENLESRSLSYAMVGKFLSGLKEEFNGGDDNIMKVTELKKGRTGE